MASGFTGFFMAAPRGPLMTSAYRADNAALPCSTRANEHKPRRVWELVPASAQLIDDLSVIHQIDFHDSRHQQLVKGDHHAPLRNQ
jgi:hypothetical protein